MPERATFLGFIALLTLLLSKGANSQPSLAIDELWTESTTFESEYNSEEELEWNGPIDNITCAFDPECFRNVTFCYFEGCCGFKECYDNGECMVATPDCQAPEEFHVDNETCLNDVNCHRNVTVCYVEGCCAFKECFDDGECLVAMPDCAIPEPIEEVIVVEENPANTEKVQEPESSAEDNKSRLL